MSEQDGLVAAESVSGEEVAAAAEQGQRTEDDSSSDRPAETAQQLPGLDTPAGGNTSAGTAPTRAGTDAQEPGTTGGINKEGAVHPNDSEPNSEENEGIIPAAEEPKAEVTPSQEPGAVPAEGAPGEPVAGGHSEERRPPDLQTKQVKEEQGAGAEDTIQGQSGGTDTKSTAADTTERDTARDAADAAEASAEGGNSPDRSTEVTEKSGVTSGQSSVGEPATPSSAGSGGSSLTRLVERSSLEQQYRALLLLRRQLLARSQRVQQRLSQHFSRKTDDGAERVEKNVGELEARYTRYLSGIREQQRFTAEERERRQQELAAFRAQVEHQTELVTAAYSSAVELRRQVALKSRSSRTGRLMTAAEVEALISREQQKELEVQEARLESLRRETRLSRLEQTLRESEELAGGIHLIDFEQLKIENQTYAEKIEERNEDLTKLRRKISSTVQILTHLKERIQFEQAENEHRQDHLQTVSTEVTRGRESLAQLKQRRDQVRSRTVNQRATAGLLGHEALLRDFEARVDEEARLVRELHTLKRDYADNQRMSQAIRHMVRTRRQQQQQGRQRAADRH